MLHRVDVGKRSLEAYRGLAPAGLLDELRERAATLRGARLVHINASVYGGGPVSDMLRSTVPLLNDLGIVAEWRIMTGDQALVDLTRAIHHGLRGAEVTLDASEQEALITGSRSAAATLEGDYDFVFVHDLPPMALPSPSEKGDGARWTWRCHVDASHTQPDVWALLRSALESYDAATFPTRDFLPPDTAQLHVDLIPPAIDPLSPSNVSLSSSRVRQVLDWLGLRWDGPLVTHVCRLDRWTEPSDLLEAYRLAAQEIPGLQLAVIGMALDDAEGWATYAELSAASRADPDVHVFTDLAGVGDIEVNALRRWSEVIVQKSPGKLFDLVIAEALWKGTAVVAGRAGGRELQIADGVGGRLVDDIGQCAAAIVELIREPKLAERLAHSGRIRVSEHFLVPRLLLNEVSLMLELAAERPLHVNSLALPARRDPVCGMALSDREPTFELIVKDRSHYLCSGACRERLAEAPARYLRDGPTSS